jgi:gluconolactonase
MAKTPSRYASGFEFVEGPAFDREGNLFVVNLKGGYISRITPRKKVSEFVNTGGGPNGAKFHANGHLFVCDCKLKMVLDIAPDGTAVDAISGWEKSLIQGPNDMVFTEDGGFYFTDPEGSSAENPIGAVYRVNTDGTMSQFAPGLAYPNGVAVLNEERRLFVAETMTLTIHEFALGPDWMSRAGQVHTELPPGGVGPDGMAFDVEGNLYVAYYGYGKVMVLDQWGNISREIDAGGQNPTNVAFGGKERRFLYITETETDSVYVIKNDTPGMALFGDA